MFLALVIGFVSGIFFTFAAAIFWEKRHGRDPFILLANSQAAKTDQDQETNDINQ